MKNKILILSITVILTSCSAKFTADKKIQLDQQLKDMYEADQVAAYIQTGKYTDYTKEQWDNFKDSVFAVNKEIVEQIFNRYGFLGFDKVGKQGSDRFWVLVQHCDKYLEFQKRVLKEMKKEIEKKNANPNNYAYLYDRVKVNGGEKQLFGTQVSYDMETTGRAFPKIGLVDSANVDKFRKEYTLEPLKDYLNTMTIFHHEMNKKYYEKMGILKPNLY